MSTSTAPYRDSAYTNGYEFAQGGGYRLPEYPFVEPPELRSGDVVRHPVVGRIVEAYEGTG